MKFRVQFWPTTLSLAGILVMIGLGAWQVQRLNWKQDLIETIAARTAMAPRQIPAARDWPVLDVAALRYLPVTASGRFLHRYERYVFTSLKVSRGRHGGPGYWVVTPLELADGTGYVLVNRGFVPDRMHDPATRAAGQVAGVVAVRGLVRQSQRPSPFTPDDNRRANIWYTMNVAALAADIGLSPVAPFVIDATASGAPGTLPQARDSRVQITNNHLSYAITWFALALCLAAVYIVFSTRKDD